MKTADHIKLTLKALSEKSIDLDYAQKLVIALAKDGSIFNFRSFMIGIYSVSLVSAIIIWILTSK